MRFLLCMLAACAGADPSVHAESDSDLPDIETPDTDTDAAGPFTLSSPDMEPHDGLPCQQQLPKFAECVAFGGDNHSPALEWSGVPSSAVSLALVLDDVAFDPPLDHWGVYNLSPTANGLAQGASGRNPPAQLPEGSSEVRRYQGSCSDGANTYRWRLFALDAEPPDSFNRVEQVEQFAVEHAVAIATMCHCPENSCLDLP